VKRLLLISCALLVAILLGFLTWVFATESGLHWAYGEARSRLPGTLSVNAISGRLSGLVKLEGLRYEDQVQTTKIGQIAMNWDPWALLKAEIDVTSLKVQALEVSLAESTGAAEPGKSDVPGSKPEIPVSLTISNAQIDGVTITRGDATYRLEQIVLSARLDSAGLEIGGLKVKSPEMGLSLKGRVEMVENYPHDVEIAWQASLPSGAIMAGDGQIAGNLASTSLTQQVQGPLAFNMNLEVRDALTELSWQASIDADSFDTTQLDLALPALQGAISLNASGDLSAARINGHVDAESAELGPLIADFEVHSLDGERRFDGLYFDSLRVSVLDGEISASGQMNWLPTLGWQAEVKTSAINPVTLLPEWPGKIDATLVSNGGMDNNELLASADITRLQGSLRNYPVSLQSSLRWRGQGIDIVRMDFASGDTSGNARGRLGEKLDLEWNLDSGNLAELYPGAQGELKASGQIEGPRNKPTVRASFSGKSVGLPGYELGAVKGDAVVDLQRWQQIAVNLEASTVKLQNRLLKSIILVADTRRVQAKIVADEGKAQVELNGEIDGESWRGQLTRADLQTRDFSDWKLKAPVTVGFSRGAVTAETLCLQSLAGGEICSSLNGSQADWKFDLAITRLPLQLMRQWMPPELKPDGVANASARLVYRTPEQLLGRIEVELPTARVTYSLREDRPEPFDYRSGRLELLLEQTGIRANAKITLISGDHFDGSITLPGANLLTVDYDTQSLQANASISARELGFITAILDGVEALKGKLDLNLTLAGTINQPQIQGKARLIDAELDIPDLDMQFTQLNINAQSENPETIVYQADALTTEGKISVRGNTLLNEARGWPTEIKLAVERLDVSKLVERWLPPQMTVEGLLDGDAELSFKAPDNLVGEIKVSSPVGTFGYPLLEGEKERWEYRDANLVLVMNNRGVSASSDIQLGRDNSLNGQLSLPGAKLLALDAASQALQAKARLDFRELDLIEALLPEIEQLQGSATLDFSADGTLAQPNLGGRAEILDAALLVPRLGLSIDRIKMTGVSGNDGQFKFMVDASSGDGDLSIQGSSRLDAAEGWPTSFTIKGDNFEIARIPEAAVNISPDLRVKLQHQSIDIQGDLIVPYARLEPKDITTAASVSDDTVVVGGEEAPQQKWLVATRINLVLGDRIDFFGFGFEGKLGGKLLVEEEPGQLARGTGSVKILEGRYRAYGQRLDIENGRLLFTGGPLTNPGLDLRAVRKTGNVTAGIKVRGRLQQPVLELYSIPAMGQTDTLSYLLLGRPLESASGEEGAMMAQAALALGLAGGDRLARSIGNQFGLDEMRIESSDSGDQASLVVGRYLSPRLYVSYGVGLVESLNSLNLRYQISEKWQLKAVSGVNQGADFLYSIER